MRYALLSILIFVSACADPKLTRRYRSHTVKDGQNGLVELSVFALDQSGRLPTVLEQLDAASSAAFLKAVANKGNPDLLVDVLTRTRPERLAHNSVIDATRFERRLIIAAAKSFRDKSVTPADRIAELEVRLCVAEGSAEFVSWDKFTTEYGEVDLGKLKLVQTRNFTLGGSVGPKVGSSLPVKVDPKYSGTRNLTEEIALKQRYVVFTGTLQKSEARIYQQGVVGIDLAGNAILDLVLTVPAHDELLQVFQPKVFDENGGWQKPKDATLYIAYLRYPESWSSVDAKLVGWYSLRSVKEAHRTVAEGDDAVVYRRGKTTGTETVELVDEKDTQANCWVIGGAKGKAFHFLQIKDLGPAFFASFEAADLFLTWLRVTRSDQPAKEAIVGTYNLTFAGKNLQAADIGALTIDVRPLNFRRTIDKSSPDTGFRAEDSRD